MARRTARQIRWMLGDVVARVRFGRPPMVYPDRASFQGVIDDFAGEPLVILTHGHEAYLIDSTEDGDAFYVGIPRVENEEGTEVDKNSGWVDDLPGWVWPVTLLTRYSKLTRRWRRNRLRWAHRASEVQ